jgi:hypothetical protein
VDRTSLVMSKHSGGGLPAWELGYEFAQTTAAL